MSIVAAEPDQLLRYAVRAGAIDDALARAVAGLPDAELAAALATLAGREAITTRWVRAVGDAFRVADAAGEGRTEWVAGTLADVYLALAVDGGDLDVAATAMAALLASGAPPAAVAGAARALGPESIARLARTRPDLIGPADGLPLAVRYAANRRLVRAAASAEEDPSRRARLAALLRTDPVTGQPRQLLVFDAAGDGRVAEVFGNPLTASSVVVVVPGVGTDLDDFDRALARPVAALVDQASDRAPGAVAAVAWLGYDPPDGLGAGPRELGALLGAGRARAGGASLARLLEGLPGGAAQRRTLVGHSYGSTTVAAALLAGAAPDHVVVLGSPGVLVDRAADFGLPGTSFHASPLPATRWRPWPGSGASVVTLLGPARGSRRWPRA